MAGVCSVTPAPLLAQRNKPEVKTFAGKYPLEINQEFLGMAAGKTVVRIRLASAELTKALTAKGVRNFSGELQGTLLQNGETKDTFKYPVSGTLGGGGAFNYSFLRALKPGTYRLTFRLRSRSEPIYFMRFCGATAEMERAENEWMIDVHPMTVEFEVR